MFIKTIMAGAVALGLFAGGASAATVTLSGGTPEMLPGIPGQDFEPQLQAAGVTTLWRGPLQLTLNGDSVLTFSLVAAESGFDNSFNFDGTSVITETFSMASTGDFLTGVLGGQTFTTGGIAGGTMISNLLSFSSPLVTAGAGMDEFGVFSSASITGAGGVSTFFLSFDDDGANSDDNHDDIIVRVDVAPVPLPAAGWLLIAGMGGLFGMRRFRRA